VSLAGSTPRPCGHEDLSRILRPKVIGESDATQEGSVRNKSSQGAAVARACSEVKIAFIIVQKEIM